MVRFISFLLHPKKILAWILLFGLFLLILGYIINWIVKIHINLFFSLGWKFFLFGFLSLFFINLNMRLMRSK